MFGPNVQFISTLAYILVIKERIYEYYIFELRKYELHGKKIIAVIDATFAVVKRKPEKKKSLACTGSRTSQRFFF